LGKIGLLGGTFNPIHLGHLITAQSLLEKRGYEKIIFIPCYISPLKTDTIVTKPIHRLKMLELAIEDSLYFESSSFEIDKLGVSYTIDTVLEFKKRYDNLELIIGYDNLLVFDKWHRPDDIFKEISVTVISRLSAPKENHINRFFPLANIVNTPVIEISSTQIRDRIKKNLPIDYFTPQKVIDYIIKNSLYK